MTRPPQDGAAPAAGWLARLGLGRPELRAWAMYDWAVSSLQTTVMVAVFPIYFVKVAGAGGAPMEASEALAYANTVALIVMTALSPLMGAVADYFAVKKLMLAGFMLLGVAACAGMFFVERGDLSMAWWLFVLALVGATGSLVPYEGLLPHIAPAHEVDRVSTAAYAVGYIGGGLLLALNLTWIQKPEWFGMEPVATATGSAATLPARLAFLSVAAWWLVFSIPVLRRVREPVRVLEPDEVAVAWSVRVPFQRLGETFREMRGYRNLFLMLLAFMLYNDGIQTVIKMATSFGTEIGINQGVLIASILLVQFVGIPCTFVFGAIAARLGAKRGIFVGLWAYALISILGYFMTSAAHFVALACLVGLVQGGTQALSRSLFSSMVPPHKSGEFFGFFSVFEKFAGIFGPLLFGMMIRFSGSSRGAILSVIAFFALGALLLWRVDEAAGQREARDHEEGLLTTPAGGA
ncbi:MAG: MFS transporter [Gemmatimonadetes bacterium]|nr:MFS transporter [Gemmatimonadota bacterium]